MRRLFRIKGLWVVIGTLLVVFAIGGLRLVDPAALKGLRYRLFDFYILNDAEKISEKPSLVTIVDIDEKSLDALGQWPWPRTELAKLLFNLKDYGALVIGMDVVYAERDRTSPRAVADNPLIPPGLSAQLSQLPDNEEAMALLMSQFPTVLGMVSRENPNDGSEIPPSSVRNRAGGIPAQNFIKRNRFSWLRNNIAILEQNARGFGVFSFVPDADGIIRRAPLIVQVDEDRLYPSLAAETMRVGLGSASIITVTDLNGILGIGYTVQGAGSTFVPTDDEGQFWIRFGVPDSYNTPDNDNRFYVSAIDVINKTVPPEKLAGKILLLGSSATGLKDLRNTPIHPALPGVEVHANIIQNILHGDFVSAPAWFALVEAVIIVVFGALMVLLARWLPLWASALCVATIIGTLFFTSYYLFISTSLLIDPTLPGIAIFLAFVLVLSGNYLRESADRRFIRKAFGQYLSPDLIERLSSQPDALKLGGEMRRMTFLFCDVQGFTAISETYKTNPQGLTHLINRLLTPLTNVILENNGAIDKYMGDCIMAFWNAPLDNDKHAFDATVSSVAMIEALQVLNDIRKGEAAAAGEKFIPLKVGIGINSGDAVVGNMGSEQRFDYSVLGDSVNLAARLEGQTRTYDVGVLIGEETAKELDVNTTPFLELDSIKVKGKAEAVAVFAVLTVPPNDFTAIRAKHNAMLQAYRGQNWDAAKTLIAELHNETDPEMHNYYTVMLERIEEYTATSPGDAWDGVFVARTK